MQQGSRLEAAPQQLPALVDGTKAMETALALVKNDTSLHVEKIAGGLVCQWNRERVMQMREGDVIVEANGHAMKRGQVVEGMRKKQS